MEKHFDKQLIMTKEDDKNFESSKKCWIWDNSYSFIKGDFKVRDYCLITRKYRSPAHRDCNFNVILNYKILIVFINLKNYDAHLIM